MPELEPKLLKPKSTWSQYLLPGIIFFVKKWKIKAHFLGRCSTYPPCNHLSLFKYFFDFNTLKMSNLVIYKKKCPHISGSASYENINPGINFLKNKNNLRCSVEKLKTKTKFVFLLFDFLPKNKLYVIHLFISANNARIVCKTFGEKLFVIGWGEWIFQEIMNPCLTWLREGREWLF